LRARSRKSAVKSTPHDPPLCSGTHTSHPPSGLPPSTQKFRHRTDRSDLSTARIPCADHAQGGLFVCRAEGWEMRGFVGLGRGATRGAGSLSYGEQAHAGIRTRAGHQSRRLAAGRRAGSRPQTPPRSTPARSILTTRAKGSTRRGRAQYGTVMNVPTRVMVMDYGQPCSKA